MSFTGIRFNVTCPECNREQTLYHMKENHEEEDRKIVDCTNKDCEVEFVIKSKVSIKTNTYQLVNAKK